MDIRDYFDANFMNVSGGTEWPGSGSISTCDISKDNGQPPMSSILWQNIHSIHGEVERVEKALIRLRCKLQPILPKKALENAAECQPEPHVKESPLMREFRAVSRGVRSLEAEIEALINAVEL